MLSGIDEAQQHGRFEIVDLVNQNATALGELKRHPNEIDEIPQRSDHINHTQHHQPIQPWLTRIYRTMFGAAHTSIEHSSPHYPLSVPVPAFNDAATRNALTQAMLLLEHDVSRLRATHTTANAMLARLGHDSFHIDSTLSQQMDERRAAEASLRCETNHKVVEVESQMVETMWALFIDANAAGSMQEESVAVAAVAEAHPDLYEQLRQCTDRRTEMQKKLEEANAIWNQRKDVLQAFQREMKLHADEVGERADRAASRLKIVEGWLEHETPSILFMAPT